MKKLCKALLGVVCLFGILIPSVNVNAQPNDKTLSELEDKIKKYDEIISKYDNKSEQLKNELDKNKNDLDKKINDLDKKITNLDMIKNTILIVGAILGITGIPSYFKIKDTIKKDINNKINDKLDTFLDSNVEKLNKLVSIKDREDKLKKDKKILVLSKGESDRKVIKRILREFEEVTCEDIDNIPKKLSNYDVVLLNNNSGVIDHTQIFSVINNNKDLNYIYYSTNGKNLEGLSGKENITFASTKVTLCTNLINLLKYQGL